METVNIDIVSDVVCPWCYLGKNRLAQAIANVSGEINVAVQWRPYQLNPDLPPEGVDHKQHLAAKLGGQAAVDDAHRMLENLGMEDGVAFNFDAVKVSPNTLDAHRLIRWAATSGEAAQAELVNLLFKAYFEEGRNVGEHTVLLDIAEQGGLERPVIAALLASDADKQAVKQGNRYGAGNRRNRRPLLHHRAAIRGHGCAVGRGAVQRFARDRTDESRAPRALKPA